MTEFGSLLPGSATAVEQAIEAAVNAALNLPIPIVDNTRAATADPRLLPFLAWSFSVDQWDAEWSVDTKRSAVETSVLIHRRKGTVGAVRAAIAAFGYGGASIVEGFGAFRFDGEILYDGAEDHGQPDHWAEYRIYLDRPMTIAQGQQLRSILERVAPARCVLRGLYFEEVAHLYNGTIRYDGAFSHGET